MTNKALPVEGSELPEAQQEVLAPEGLAAWGPGPKHPGPSNHGVPCRDLLGDRRAQIQLLNTSPLKSQRGFLTRLLHSANTEDKDGP